jgi:hypothetical protein
MRCAVDEHGMALEVPRNEKLTDNAVVPTRYNVEVPVIQTRRILHNKVLS